MTTIENPTTEQMNGSSRITTATESPWWMVRPSLSAALIGSFAVAAGAFRIAGMPGGSPIFTRRLIEDAAHFVSATPTLVAIALVACAFCLRAKSERSMRVLWAMLAAASLAGVAINFARDARGQSPVETWVENALANDAAAVAAK